MLYGAPVLIKAQRLAMLTATSAYRMLSLRVQQVVAKGYTDRAKNLKEKKIFPNNMNEDTLEEGIGS